MSLRRPQPRFAGLQGQPQPGQAGREETQSPPQCGLHLHYHSGGPVGREGGSGVRRRKTACVVGIKHARVALLLHILPAYILILLLHTTWWSSPVTTPAAPLWMNTIIVAK